MERRLTLAYVLSIISVVPIFFLSVPLPLGEGMKEILRKSVYALISPIINPSPQHFLNIVVLVVFVVSLIYSFRGSRRGRLAWLGCVFYFGYIQIVYFVKQIFFFNKDSSWDYLFTYFLGETSAYFFPFFLSLAAFIIGLTSLKDIEIKNKASFGKLARITAVVFIVYLTLILSHLIFWLRINILINLQSGEPLYAGGQDLVNIITIIPFFVFVVVILLKKREMGGIITPAALFPMTIPILHTDLIYSFGFNVFKMIRNLIKYIYRCLFQNLDANILAYMSDDPKSTIYSIDTIYWATDKLLKEARAVLLIIGVILIALFLKNIKETPEQKRTL